MNAWTGDGWEIQKVYWDLSSLKERNLVNETETVRRENRFKSVLLSEVAVLTEIVKLLKRATENHSIGVNSLKLV